MAQKFRNPQTGQVIEWNGSAWVDEAGNTVAPAQGTSNVQPAAGRPSMAPATPAPAARREYSPAFAAGQPEPGFFDLLAQAPPGAGIVQSIMGRNGGIRGGLLDYAALTTSDKEDQKRLIQARIPGAIITERPDGLYVKHPQTGEEVPFNATGPSGQDAQAIINHMAPFLLRAPGAKALPSAILRGAANALPGSMAREGIEAAARGVGGVEAAPANATMNDVVLDTAFGAAGDALAGPVAQGVGRAASGLLGRMAKQPFVDVEALVKSIGVDPATVSPQARALFKEAYPTLKDPAAALRYAEAKAANVPLNIGQITGDPTQLAMLDAIEKSPYAKASARVKNSRTDAADAIQAQGAAVREAAGVSADTTGENLGAGLQRTLLERARSAKAASKAKFDAVDPKTMVNLDPFKLAPRAKPTRGAAGPALPGPTKPDIFGDFAEPLAREFSPTTAPGTFEVARDMARAANKLKAVPFKGTWEGWRSKLSNLAKNGNGSDRAAAGMMLKRFDDLTDDLIERGAIPGDAGAQIKEARESYKAYKQEFGGSNTVVDKLVGEKRFGGVVEPIIPEREVSTTLFGANRNNLSLGKGFERDIAALAKSAPDEFPKVQADAVDRLVGRITSATTRKQIDDAERFLLQNRGRLTENLLTPEHFAGLNQLIRNQRATMARSVGSPPSGVAIYAEGTRARKFLTGAILAGAMATGGFKMGGTVGALALGSAGAGAGALADAYKGWRLNAKARELLTPNLQRAVPGGDLGARRAATVATPGLLNWALDDREQDRR